MNRSTDYIFGLSSLIGLVITVVVTAYAIAQDKYATEASVLIFSLGTINFLLAVIVVRSLQKVEIAARELAQIAPQMRANEVEIVRLKEQFAIHQRDLYHVGSIVHNIHDQFRDRTHELLAEKTAIDADDPPSQADLVDLQRTNEMFYLFLANNLKSLLDILTGDSCAVSIKLLAVGESGVLMLKTLMRDSSSYRARKGADSSAVEYPYYENTAFYEILAGEQRNYYASDNLSGESTYVNSNRNWKQLYNATLVCPIRMRMIPDEDSGNLDYSVLGFVCIDNMRGGLATPAAVEFLASVADSLYNHLLLLDYISEAADLDDENGTGVP